MLHAWNHFRFCPRCGHEYAGPAVAPTIVLWCAHCEYEFYQHSSPAATAVIPSAERPDQVLLLTRNTPPGRGLLALPGGFLQYDERPVDAMRREVREETLIDVEPDVLLDSYLVDYEYKGARVSVVELVFLTRPIGRDVRSLRSGEASGLDYYDCAEILRSPSRLAFPEQQQSLARYREYLKLA
jgi:ADP-ribose pyrophosphatase YjhB (NUDIX family)